MKEGGGKTSVRESVRETGGTTLPHNTERRMRTIPERVVAFALVFFRSGFDRHRLFVFLVLSLRACVNRGPSQSYYTKSISSLSSLYFPLVSLVGDDGLDMDLGT